MQENGYIIIQSKVPHNKVYKLYIYESKCIFNEIDNRQQNLPHGQADRQKYKEQIDINSLHTDTNY